MNTLQRMKTRSRKGVAAVEAAVCIPLLVLLVFGSIEITQGIFLEYNAHSCIYELGKTALKGKATGDEIKAQADSLVPAWGFQNYEIDIEVLPRTVNADSVEPADTLLFEIDQSDTESVTGFEDVPRGTLLRMNLSADRPPSRTNFFGDLLGQRVIVECVFVKEQ